MTPKFSIILPVKNGGEYVKECVNSILSQTLNSFNLIVLDNCSTDGTREWIQSLDNERITLLTSEHPLNIEDSWTRITKIEKNEFITIIGHDDILYPDFLKSIDELIDKEPSASLYLTHFDLIDARGKIIRRCKPMQAVYTGNELLKAILTNSIDIMGTGYVMRATDYDLMGGIPVKYPRLLYADFELWVNFANINFEAVSSKSCFSFRMHQSTAHSSQDERMHKAMALFIDYLADLKQKNEKMKKVIDEYAAEFLLFYCTGFTHRLLRTDISQRIPVNTIIQETRIWARKIGVIEKYHPEKLYSIKLAKMIDSNKTLRKIFLLFKKIYPKPIIKKQKFI